MIATDSRGTPIAVIDQMGSVRPIQHDAFGNLLSTNPLEIGFAGGFADIESGLTYFVSRWYDAENGRFTQTDDAPADDFDTRSLNRYTYSLNDPVNRIDPLGQTSLIETLSSLKVQATVAAITAIGVGSGAAEIVLWGISGGRINFDDVNKTGTTRPFLEFSLDRAKNRSGSFRYAQAGYSRGAEIQFGFELLSLDEAPNNSLFGYLGAGLGFAANAGATTQKSYGLKGEGTGGGGGASFRGAVGDVFDTPTYSDYKGWFVSIIGGFTISGRVGEKKAGGVSFTNGRIRALAFSTVPGSSGEYSHTKTDFKAGISASGNGKAAALNVTMKAGIGGSYYFQILTSVFS